MDDSQVLISRNGEVATITLNNPRRRNALSAGMMRELTEALTQVGASDALVVVLAAEGPVFSAGHNLGELVGLDLPGARALFGVCVTMMETIQAVPQPVIARVHGMAAAGGCQLVAGCDLAVAGESAGFALPGIKRGLFCHTPLVAVSRAVLPKHAFEMAITGDVISARQAADWGLVNQTVPDAELDAAVDTLVHRIIDEGSPYARAMGKKGFYAQLGLPQSQAYALAAELVAANALLDDAQEGFASFMEKRSPHFTSRPNGTVSN